MYPQTPHFHFVKTHDLPLELFKAQSIKSFSCNKLSFMKPEIVYGALAVLLLFSLGFAFFVNNEISGVKQQLKVLERKPDTTAVLISGLDRRISEVENKLQKESASAKLFAFYDSSCGVCGNEGFLQAVTATRPQLEKEGIRLEAIDVKDNPTAALGVGVKTVPTFFASSSDLALNSRLVDFINQLATLQYGFFESAKGVIAQPPVSQVILSQAACSSDGSIRVQEFYSPTCAYCRRMSYANGTAYNPASTDAFREIAGESFINVTKEFGAKLNASSHCIGIHTLDENRQVLGVNASDEGLCLESVSAEAIEDAERLSDRYGLIGTPAFVVDCKYITKTRTTSSLKDALCAIRPELCA